jgi:hypothetical protein
LPLSLRASFDETHILFLSILTCRKESISHMDLVEKTGGNSPTGQLPLSFRPVWRGQDLHLTGILPKCDQERKKLENELLQKSRSEKKKCQTMLSNLSIITCRREFTKYGSRPKR